MQFNDAAYSAVAIVLLSVCGVFSFNRITYMGSYNGSKVRTAVCGLVYRKVGVCLCCWGGDNANTEHSLSSERSAYLLRYQILNDDELHNHPLCRLCDCARHPTKTERCPQAMSQI